MIKVLDLMFNFEKSPVLREFSFVNLPTFQIKYNN